jgi:non-specific serine/threonine protein kinase
LHARNLLILLDNCEHLLAVCAQFADTVLRACPHLKILVSSREALGVTGETTYRVPSLSCPAPTSDFLSLSSPTQYDAVRLFIDRARMILPSFQVTNQNPLSVAQICYRLDGIPLAIELAAARIKGMKAEQIAQRLDDRFRLLTDGSRTALPRHQTLRAAVDWSYSLLSETERKLLGRLSVFAGGWTLEAADAVCSGDGIETNDVLDLLLHLIGKSLVMVDEEAASPAARYGILETIRQYAREKLLDSCKSEHIRDRHLDFYLKFAEDAEPKLNGADQGIWFNQLETEHDNLRAALEWSLELGAGHDRAELAMRLAGALTWFWIKRGYFNEGRNWLERSLESPTITPARAKPLLRLGIMNYFVGTNEKCHALCAESLGLYRQQGDKWGITLSAVVCGARGNDPSRADALFEEARLLKQELKDEWLAAATDIIQGGSARRRGDFSVARSLIETALDHARRSGDRWMIGNALENLGLVALDQGDDDRAGVLLTEGLDFHREMGDKHQIANNLNGLGVVAERRHDFQQAEALTKEALELRREIGDTPNVVRSVWALGRVATTEQRYERAARIFGATQALREKLGDPLSTAQRIEYESYLASARAQLDETTFNTAWAEGRAMTMEQAIECALAE